MKILKSLGGSALLSIVLISSPACSVRPGYSADTSRTGVALFGGVRSREIAPGIYRINANGNSFTTAAEMSDFAYLRAAQLALEAGRTYFVVLETRDLSTAAQYTTSSAQPGQRMEGSSNADGSIPTVGYTDPSPATRRRIVSAKPGEGLDIAVFDYEGLSAWRSSQPSSGRQRRIYEAEPIYRTLSGRVRGDPFPLSKIYARRATQIFETASRREIASEEDRIDMLLDAYFAQARSIRALEQEGASAQAIGDARLTEQQIGATFAESANSWRADRGLPEKSLFVLAVGDWRR